MKNKHVGGSFEDFLEKEGLGAEVAARAAKRTFSHQLQERMKERHVRKSYFRSALGSPSTTERLFNDHVGISLETMVRAAGFLGCDLQINLVERDKRKTKKRAAS